MLCLSGEPGGETRHLFIFPPCNALIKLANALTINTASCGSARTATRTFLIPAKRKRSGERHIILGRKKGGSDSKRERDEEVRRVSLSFS